MSMYNDATTVAVSLAALEPNDRALDVEQFEAYMRHHRGNGQASHELCYSEARQLA